MRKILYALGITLCVLMCGCSGEKDGGGTEQESSVVQESEQVSVSVPESTEPVESESTATTQTTVAEPTPETEPSSAPETEESVESVEEESPYAEMVMSFGNTYLGLPSEERVYIFSDADKTAEIEGVVCHGVSVYDEYEGTLYYMCDFYVTEDGATVYRYYEQEERYALLPETQGFERLNPSAQTPDEIFGIANRLYGLFAAGNGDIAVDMGSVIEQNGQLYLLVTDKALGTKGDLLDALTKYFSDEIVNGLMDTNRFIEQDGAMYYRLDSSAGVEPSYRSTVYELTTLSSDTAVFTGYSTFEYEAGVTEEKVTEYTAVKANGVWRFTQFSLPWN